jgi:hypothetical protein
VSRGRFTDFLIGGLFGIVKLEAFTAFGAGVRFSSGAGALLGIGAGVLLGIVAAARRVGFTDLLSCGLLGMVKVAKFAAFGPGVLLGIFVFGCELSSSTSALRLLAALCVASRETRSS